jgi:hypothetical protein
MKSDAGRDSMALLPLVASAGGAPSLSFDRFTAGFQGLMQRSNPANGALPHGAE